MLIREFAPKNLKRVYEIELMSFNQAYGINLIKQLYDYGAGFLVAEEEGYVVGYIIFWIKGENEGHIISLAVDKNFRRQKIGTSLLRKAILIFKTFSVEKITLEVNVNNKEAINFYLKSNFKIDKEVSNYYENNEAALFMYLDL